MPLSSDRAFADAVVATLRDAGHTAYLAGGCVRDLLLGLEPQDYDIATDAPPPRVQALFPRTAAVGAAFGVVLVRGVGPFKGHQVEVATFRSDGHYQDQRRPESVTFSTPEADARRRDFTINALFLDPLNGGGTPAGAVFGRVIDFVGGRDDLKLRRLRAVGDPDERLAEDHLRAIRAVRFAARYGFQIDAATAEAIARHAAELKGVSRERVGDEVRRILAHPSRAEAVEWIGRLGLAPGTLGVDAVPSTAVEALACYRPPAGASASEAAMGALAVVQHAVSQAPPGASAREAWTAAARQRLSLSNLEAEALDAALDTAPLVEFAAWEVAQQKRFAASRWFDLRLAAFAAANAEAAAEVREHVEMLAARPGGIAPPPLLDGNDLISLRLEPGPQFKVILDRVYDLQLEGRVRSRAQACDEAIRIARELSGLGGR